jgi:putative nucleotidyltransferase with HDIG domain
MSIEASQNEQLLEDTLVRRPGSRLSAREAMVSGGSIAALTAATVALWLISPPHPFAIAPAVLCVLVLAVSSRIRFYSPLGFTVPTQLAFVPLVFALPPALVPIGVVIAFLLSALPHAIAGKMPASRLLVQPTNAWFSVGPAAVFAIAHVPADHAGAALLLAALVAQFVIDSASAAVFITIALGVGFMSQLKETWVYAVDAALSPPALLAAESLHKTPLAAVAMVPLLGLLAVFAHERQRRLQSTLELSNAYRGTALVLGDVVEADDGYTSEHCKSVVGLALEVAAELRLDDARRRNLEFGALLHDVGKIAIPKEILNKPGKLDPHEWEIMKSHAIEGQKMLDQVGGFMADVGLIVRAHHERWDGGGYPDGLAAEQIPLEARIIACCDTWNAMRTDRPYRKALTHEVAAAELTSVSGTQLDPAIVDALLPIVVAADAQERERAVAVDRLSPDEAGAPPPQLVYGSAHPAC